MDKRDINIVKNIPVKFSSIVDLRSMTVQTKSLFYVQYTV